MNSEIKSNVSSEDKITNNDLSSNKKESHKYFSHNISKHKGTNIFHKIDLLIFNYFFSVDRKKKLPQMIVSITYLLIVCFSSFVTIVSLVVPIHEKLFFDQKLMIYYFFVIALFIFDWLIRFYYAKFTILITKKIFIKYILYQLRPSSILDLVSWLIPLTLIFYYPPSNDYFFLIPTFLILKTFTLFRLFEIINKNENLKVLVYVFKKSIRLILIVILSMIALDLIFAIFIFNVETITPPLVEGTQPKVLNYFDSVWFCFITITTIGYGDIYPVTAAGRTITIILAILGIGFYSFLTSIIVNSFTKYLDELKKKKEKNTMNTQKVLLDEYKKEIYKKIDSLNKKNKINEANIDSLISNINESQANDAIEQISNSKIENLPKNEKVLEEETKNKFNVEKENILDESYKIENVIKNEKIEKKENHKKANTTNENESILDENYKIENQK